MHNFLSVRGVFNGFLMIVEKTVEKFCLFVIVLYTKPGQSTARLSWARKVQIDGYGQCLAGRTRGN